METQASSDGRPHDGGEMGPPSKRLKVEQTQPLQLLSSGLILSSSTTTSSHFGEADNSATVSSSSSLPSSALPSSPKEKAQGKAEMHQRDEVKIDGAVEIESDFARDQEKEKAVGIKCTVNSANEGFEGTNKQRYTDFQVHEMMLPDGEVVHLTDDKAPKCSKLDASVTAFVPSAVIAPIAPVAATSPEPAHIPASSATTTVEKATESIAEGAEPMSENVTPVFPIREDHKAELGKYLTEEFTDELIAFHQKVLTKPDAKPAVFGTITCPSLLTDRIARGNVHAIVRELFCQRIESATDQYTQLMKFSAAPKGGQATQNSRSDRNQPKKNAELKGKLGWDERGGPYLHFTLYKENKDTMEVIGLVAKLLRTKPADFSFAGTKDRRAATVQRVSVYHQTADKLANLNRQLRGSRLGNFSYHKQRLELGELAGNQFTITLRDCHFGSAAQNLDEAGKIEHAKQVVGAAVEGLIANGFLNYFGLQRFGTHEIGTDHIGMLILQQKFKDAVDGILAYKEETLTKSNSLESLDKIGRDELNRAKAIHMFRTTGSSFEALNILPRRFGAETTLIRHLGGRGRSTDYLGALLMINRNLKTMYVHAYQSKVWNTVVSERWVRYGNKVVAGDLILVDRAAVKAAALDEVDENGEIVINAQGEDAAVNHDDLYERARPLTPEEAASGKYTIFDIVLPSPGYDMEYPANDIGDFYREYMQSEEGGGLDPGNMRRQQKDFSLSGAYRKFMATIGNDFSFEVKTYSDEIEQLVKTDWEILQEGRTEKENMTGHDNARNDAYRNGGAQNGCGRGGRGNDRGGRGRGRGAAVNTRSEIYASTARNREDPRLAGWNNIVAQIPREEQLAAAAARLTEPTRGKATSAPVIEDLWVQTTPGDASSYTGVQSENVHKPEIDVEEETIKSEMEVDKKIDGPIVTVIERTDTMSTVSSIDPDSFGGAPLISRTSSSTVLEAQAAAPLNADVKADWNMSEDESTAVVPLLNESESVEASQPKRIAVIVKFSLGSSQYATIALRELMQGVKTYKPDYSSGR